MGVNLETGADVPREVARILIGIALEEFVQDDRRGVITVKVLDAEGTRYPLVLSLSSTKLSIAPGRMSEIANHGLPPDLPGELEVVDGVPESGKIHHLARVPSASTPDYAPEEMFESAENSIKHRASMAGNAAFGQNKVSGHHQRAMCSVEEIPTSRMDEAASPYPPPVFIRVP